MKRSGHALVATLVMAWLSGAVGCRRAPVEKPADFPAGRVARPETLVSPGWVRAAITHRDGEYRGERPAGWRHDRFVVVEAAWVRPGESAAHDRGHVPGAVLLNTEDLENGYPRWQLRPGGELQRAIGRVGITPEATVVVYGRSLIAAARVWWILGYAGVSDVRLMDGGFEAWRDAGYGVEKGWRAVEATTFAAKPRTHWLATTDEVKARLATGDVWLGDLRSVEEFAGATSGYSYLDARGRLPGAVHLGDADDRSPLYGTRDGRLRPPRDVLALWQDQGLALSDDARSFRKDVVFYCGGGWRSSLAFFYAWLLGLENVRNYSDGWAGWSTHYVPDSTSGGSTAGWRQSRTTNPIDNQSVEAAAGNPAR